MNSEANNLYKIEKLGHDNYMSWSFKMKMLLKKEEVYDTIIEEAPNPVTEEWNKKSEKALQLIVLSCLDNQIVYLRTANTGKEAWESLKEHHKQPTLTAKIRIMKKLFRKELTRGGSMREHLDNLFTYFDELSEIDSAINEDIKIGIILSSLNQDYDNVVTAMEAWDETKITVQTIKRKLLEEADKIQEKLEKFNYNNKQMDVKSVCIPAENFTPVTVQKEVSFASREGFLCHFCRKPGHFRKNCQDLRLKLQRNKRQKEFENKDEEVSAKSCRSSKWYKSVLFDDWYIDSGATTHMCKDKNLFKNIEYNCNTSIVVANGETIKAEGRGDVDIFVKNGKNYVNVTLSEVLYVPDIDSNLISVKRLTERGFIILFEGTNAILCDEGKEWKIAQWNGKLYKLLTGQSCLKTSEKEEKCLHEWHRILAHRNYDCIKGMKLLIKECACTNDCEACIKGKLSKKPFPKKASPTKGNLDCISSDLCGPFQIETMGKKRYFMTLNDIHSGYTEVKLLREKSETTDLVIEFIELLKTQLGKKPKIFRSDRGGEYMNDRLQNYFAKEGIKFQCTVGYAPQQNGIAERKNRTLVEAVRSMLSESGLPLSLWGEAVCTANYVFNRIPDKNGKSPIEKLFKEKPNLSEFFEFGTNAS
jgi:transposase InsO family protein